MSVRPFKRSKGFRQTSALVETRVRTASEGRGFAVSRLLTRWEEVAGPDLAPLCRPLKVGYGRSSLGATLTVLTNGPSAPLLEMQKETLRTRVNACYGYNAISRIAITQTAPDGLSLEVTKPAREAPKPDAQAVAKAPGYAKGVGNDDLRQALEDLAANVLTRSARRAGST